MSALRPAAHPPVIQCAELPSTPESLPLGTSKLPGTDLGVDLPAAGYEEREYIVSGNAAVWTHDARGIAVQKHPGVPYTTRMLVRRPRDDRDFSGVVYVEPLHREYDSAPTWRTLHSWIMRSGAGWVGITQDPYAAASLRQEFDPDRYKAISIPMVGMSYDLVGGIGAALRSDSLGALPPVARAYLSGWSMTGTFCRVFLGDGFHDRHRLADGSPVFDGYVIGISSGGAPRAGYAPLCEGDQIPGEDDPRRTIRGHDVPVIELLSEFESETHAPCLRPDADEPGDRYRLYQVAGTSHDGFGGWSGNVNREQYRRRGAAVPALETNEPRSDARGEVVARAVFALLDRWTATGIAPPGVSRFELDRDAPAPANPTGPAVALRRDPVGNVIGGVRTPWVQVPTASYEPHSTPKPGSCVPAPGAPALDPSHVASLLGKMSPLPAEALRELYGSRDSYLTRYADASERLCEQELLLREDLPSLLKQAEQRDIPLP